MPSNSFGCCFKISTWGESHGPAIGVIVDGCPAGLEISQHEIQTALQARAPGRSSYTSPRSEPDTAEILSGIFEGKTTGAPICIMIRNADADSSNYEPIKDLLRPGHANFTHLKKYGIFDYRGGGRSSARETACRVAAGAIANKILSHYGILTTAYIKQIGPIEAMCDTTSFDQLQESRSTSPIFCPDAGAASQMMALIKLMHKENDSIGGVVEFFATGLQPGLGDPIYEKLDARLAYALMGIPGSKGFEIGTGFHSASMKGSVHNDLFVQRDGRICTQTNHAGGLLGGISTGMPLVGRVAFKPTSSIQKNMDTLTTSGEEASFQLPKGSRHDPCIAIRAVCVVEAMVNLVLADAVLMDRCARL